jgi:hypothetical protein
MYADDIVLVSASISMLQKMLAVCQGDVEYLQMKFNVAKSVIIRFGKRWSTKCCGVVLNGAELQFVDRAKYLGVHLVSSRRFRLSFSEAKCNFFKAFNGLLYKCKNCPNETVMMQLINSFCKPFLLYCCESVALLRSECGVLQQAWNCVYYKLFNTSNA